MKIVTYPDKRLNQKSKKVRKVTKEIRDLAFKMLEIMKKERGIGLSAVQIGKMIRLVVVGYEPPKNVDEETLENLKQNEQIPTLILINPKITKKSKETDILDEGCLSCPGIELPIERSLSCNVLATDLEDHRMKIRAKGLFARVLQHEIDHLNGILIYDRTDKNTLKKLKKKKEKNSKRTIL